MITNTHILFLKILYENCLKDLNFKLDRYKFMYGNIKIKTKNSLLQGNVVEFIYKMQKKYFDENQSLVRDIIYALETANTVAEGIIYYILKSDHKLLNNLLEEIS